MHQKRTGFGRKNDVAQLKMATGDGWRGLYGSDLFSSILAFIKCPAAKKGRFVS